jgi:nitroreductase
MSTENVRPDIDVLEGLLLDRHSCRAYTGTKVPQELIERILSASQRSASDCNIQPWRIIVLSGAALNRLRDAMYERAASGAAPVWDIPPIEQYTGVYQERRRECGWLLYGAVGVQKGDRIASGKQALENFRFFGAPHLALLTTHASLGARALLDCGGYIASFLLAAQALHVAAVPQASIAYRADVIREQLALPQDQYVVCGISFGWAQEEHAANSYRTTRARVQDVVEFRSE